MLKKILKPIFNKNKPSAAPTPAEFYRELETDVLARTLWGEARGEGTEGMQAVACVILNRVAISESKAGYWWGNTIIEVCQKAYQFSCWNRSDPNFHQVQSVDERDIYFATALRVARRALAGTLSDPTHGATHYHADNITPPYWARTEKPVVKIGNHVFYKLIEA